MIVTRFPILCLKGIYGLKKKKSIGVQALKPLLVTKTMGQIALFMISSAQLSMEGAMELSMEGAM